MTRSTLVGLLGGPVVKYLPLAQVLGTESHIGLPQGGEACFPSLTRLVCVPALIISLSLTLCQIYK